jgi:hypothetical protein
MAQDIIKAGQCCIWIYGSHQYNCSSVGCIMRCGRNLRWQCNLVYHWSDTVLESCETLDSEYSPSVRFSSSEPISGSNRWFRRCSHMLYHGPDVAKHQAPSVPREYKASQCRTGDKESIDAWAQRSRSTTTTDEEVDESVDGSWCIRARRTWHSVVRLAGQYTWFTTRNSATWNDNVMNEAFIWRVKYCRTMFVRLAAVAVWQQLRQWLSHWQDSYFSAGFYEQ